jgi:hypothetical protein
LPLTRLSSVSGDCGDETPVLLEVFSCPGWMQPIIIAPVNASATITAASLLPLNTDILFISDYQILAELVFGPLYITPVQSRISEISVHVNKISVNPALLL